jgi:p-hydroxybenzoate 3-monooxygenase
VVDTLRTQVAIIGGGPAGTLLSHLLRRAGIENVVLEQRSRAHVLSRIRAGVIEHGSAALLRDAGLGARMDAEGHVHDGVALAFDGRKIRIDFRRLADAAVVIYGQTELQKDLYAAIDSGGGALYDEVDGVSLANLEANRPSVAFERDGRPCRIDCDFVAGCDGFHGVSRSSIPAERLATYERVYPFGWLGILSETPPVDAELIYANHERGFALCSMRNSTLSRYYLQCPLDARVEDWPDPRFWDELKVRLPEDASAKLVTGPSIEKSIAPLRSFVAEPLRYGALFLAGDAGHIVPPTGAKGLNLAISDVSLLARAFEAFYRTGSRRDLDAYSDVALRRVWRAVRFSWWMTSLLHRFPDGGEFNRKLQIAELELLACSATAQRLLAEDYVGIG